jgi:hypothetical protein
VPGSGSQVTLHHGAVVGAAERLARPRAPGFYRAIRMMRVATVRRALATLP